MGCCGSCGGEAPNHINDQDKSKEDEKSKKEETSQSQGSDKEKK